MCQQHDDRGVQKNMTVVPALRKSALNRYKDYLRDLSSSVLLSTPSTFFPWVYRGSKGRVTDSYHDGLALYSELYASSKEKTGRGYTLVTESVNTRSYGVQTVIKDIVIENEEDYLKFIGKEKEGERFLTSLTALKVNAGENGFSLSALACWVRGNLDFLQEEKEEGYYSSLFSSLVWLIHNQDSGLYIREIPVPVHTKFIEENAKVILSLFVSLTGKEASTSFEETFGLRRKEALIRYRMKNGREETGLRRADFEELGRSGEVDSVRRVYVVENEIVYLTFPLDDDMMCVFGGGFAVSSLVSALWMKEKDLYYFGDEDEHGYEILALFRSYFPSVKSFLMDRETYLDHVRYAVRGRNAASLYDSLLTEEELKTLTMLRDNSEKSRLEQERISIAYIKSRL